MIEVANGVFRLGLFPKFAVNSYLVGGVLFDASTRVESRHFVRSLRGRTIDRIVLTHVHPDHQGVAATLCDAYDCPLACHAADAPAMEGRVPMGPPKWPIRPISNWLAGRRHRVDQTLRDGDEIAGFGVVETPGHTPGHIAFFRESDRVAIAGDLATYINLLTMRAGLHEPPRFFSDDWRRNRDSIRLLASLRPSTVLFGHGPPLRDEAMLQDFADSLD